MRSSSSTRFRAPTSARSTARDCGVWIEPDRRRTDQPPGTRFRYESDRYALLDSVVRRADSRSFGEAVVQRVIVPARLPRTAPSSVANESIRAALAQGYGGGGGAVAYPTYVGTAAGLLSTVLDLVAYASAINTGQLYPPGSRDLAFTAARNAAGTDLPYGQGWFVDERLAGKVVWHFGSWTGNSSLLVLAPEEGTAFALLANSDRLSTPFPLASGALESSSFAEAFLGWLEEGEGCGP